MSQPNNLRNSLITELQKLPEVEVDLWPNSDLMCVFFRGKEIAHFHDNEEIDIRLSQKFIKAENLKPLEGSKYHKSRSKKSRWMQFRLTTHQQATDLLDLIQRLIESDYRHTDWGSK